jgi:hypothetical protein
LLLAVASAAVRLAGDHNAADLLAFAFFSSATLDLYRAAELRAAVRTVRS